MADIEIRTTSASGEALEWLVIKALGYTPFLDIRAYRFSVDDKAFYIGNADFSRAWKGAGPLLQTSQMDLRKTVQHEGDTTISPGHAWKAETVATNPYFCAYGETPQVAICRCFVASKLGYIVKVPKELLK